MLDSIFDVLGLREVFIGVVGSVVVLVLTPWVDRWLVHRKRLSYRELYNSKVGLGPDLDGDSNPAAGDADTQERARQLESLLNRMSIVVYRFRNTGLYNIQQDDFAVPMTLTFDKRVVWNARISEAESDQVQDELKAGLTFFGTGPEPAGAAEPSGDLGTVRVRLAQRILGWAGDGGRPNSAEAAWRGVRLDNLGLGRRQQFKLVVVLYEPDAGEGAELDKAVAVAGRLRDSGVVRDESRQRLVTLPRATGVLAGVLAALLVATLIFRPPPQDSTIACASGDLQIVGSTVFMPVVSALAEEYAESCRGARVDTEATGSIEGVRSVDEAAASEAGTLVAVSDGRPEGGPETAIRTPLAILVFQVIVHESAGVTNLTLAQLRGMYSGEITDWSEIRGGESLPIRLVGRSSVSGSRDVFEREVLGAGEGEVSSNDCQVRDRPTTTNEETIRCERGSNEDIAKAVGEIPGALGYADKLTVQDARQRGTLNAVTLDGKVYDEHGIVTGYEFWTVEHLYTQAMPEEGSLQEIFGEFVKKHPESLKAMKSAGLIPCVSESGILNSKCNLR